MDYTTVDGWRERSSREKRPRQRRGLLDAFGVRFFGSAIKCASTFCSVRLGAVESETQSQVLPQRG